MSFLTPIWLLSIAAISIPLLIHLWNITPGKTLKVGSISLIELSSRKSSRSLKLVDLLLLLLRCLFITLLALVLALPYFKNSVDSKKEKGWLLIPKEDFKEAYQKFKTKTDSLIKSGYELHYFNTGFKKIAIAQALADTAGNTNTPFWTLLQELTQQKSADFPIYLITPNLLSKFSGNRPKLDLKLTWQTYTPADSTSTSIKKAWFTANKDVRVVVTISTPAQTYQRPENINPASSKSSPYNIQISAGIATISLKSDEQRQVNIDTAALNVDVYSAQTGSDGEYLNAALQSIKQFTQQNIIVKNYSTNDIVSTKHDWLFWLSDKPVATKLLRRYKNVFVYESGKIAAAKCWINHADDNNEVVALFKTVIFNKNNGESVWQDGFGNPLLTSELKDQTKLYHFYSRFNPGWNDLVWNAAFPQIIQSLIYADNSSKLEETTDRRKIDASQIIPVIVKRDDSPPVNTKQQTDITHYFWLLMVLIFMLERWLAHKKQGGAAAA